MSVLLSYLLSHRSRDLPKFQAFSLHSTALSAYTFRVACVPLAIVIFALALAVAMAPDASIKSTGNTPPALERVAVSILTDGDAV